MPLPLMLEEFLTMSYDAPKKETPPPTSGDRTEMATRKPVVEPSLPDEDLIERLRDIAVQRAKTAAYGGADEKLITEWIAADRIVALLKEAEDTARILGDPVAVHLNMLTGRIAPISMENCAHANGVQFNDLEAAEAALASLKAENERLKAALKPFAAIPPVVYSELDNSPLYAAHYWAVVGHPDKSHFTREDLARARAALSPTEEKAK